MPRFSSYAAVLAVSAALLTACGGSSAPAAPQTVPAPSGGASSAAAAPSASTSASVAPNTSVTATASAHRSASAAGAAPSPDAVSGGGSGAGSAGGQTSSAGVPLMPPGTYTYRFQGKSSSVLGDQNYDGDSTLTVDQPNGSRQHSEQRDSQGSVQQVVAAKADGLHLAEIHLTQQGFDEDFKPSHPVLLFPAKAHKGQHWNWQMTSTDGKYTLTAQLTVDDLTARSVALSSVLHIHSSDIDLTIHQHDKAGRDAVILRETSKTDGTAYGTPFHSSGTRVLTKRPS